MRRVSGGMARALLLWLAVLLSGCPALPAVAPATPSPVSSPTAALVAALPTPLPPSATVQPSATTLPPPTATATAAQTPSATPTVPAKPTVAATPTAVVPSVDGARAWQHVSHLSGTIGPRPVGSAGGRAAADYLATQLSGLGYEVERQRFPYQTYVEESSWLRVETPRPLTIGTRALRFSPSGEARGALIDIGLGRVADLTDKDVAGKVALVQRGQISFQEKVSNAARAGALAVVVSNDEAGPLSGTLVESRGVPALGITRADGEVLRSLLAAGQVTVDVGLRAEIEDFGGQNLLATRPGASGDLLVISAHYDSVDVPGANDNASGVGLALEVARALAARGQRYTVQIALYDAEEVGLVGSRYHVNTLRQQGRTVVANLNLDMVGVGPNLKLSGSEPLLARALARGKALGLNPTVLADQRSLSSDHASFLAADLPALFVHRDPDPNYHSPRDVASAVSPALLATTGRFVLSLVEMLSAG
ncbi:MAG: M28 family peptidase [Chloroflexota bacterium]